MRSLTTEAATLEFESAKGSADRERSIKPCATPGYILVVAAARAIG
jgi:hypothetical protein